MDKNLQELLSAAFAETDIEWRLQWSDEAKGQGLAVPYVTNRAIQNRLDKAVGINNWKNEYIPWHHDGKKASQICGISIYFEERKEWITKYDGAENSDIEAVKGGLSDSMKRAAVQWGIGRYLYGMDAVFVTIEKKGRSTIIKASEQSKLDKAHREHVARVFNTKPAATPQQQPKPDKQTPPQEQPKPEQQAKTGQPARSNPPAAASDTKSRPINEDVFEVMNAVLQPTVKGNKNTHIRLKRQDDGQIIQVYLQGENTAVIPGALLTDAQISEKIKDGVRFLILDAFRLEEAAAA